MADALFRDGRPPLSSGTAFGATYTSDAVSQLIATQYLLVDCVDNRLSNE